MCGGRGGKYACVEWSGFQWRLRGLGVVVLLLVVGVVLLVGRVLLVGMVLLVGVFLLPMALFMADWSGVTPV